MKYLHLNDINFQTYDYYGFDMDGTLYAEKLFIEQAYKEIANYFSHNSNNDYENIYNWMINRWNERGSSYPHIFSETMKLFNLESKSIKHVLDIYRTIQPSLYLEDNVKYVLEKVPISKRFFISDGHPRLQRNKFNALNLGQFFSLKNCCFTGDFGTEYYKPSREAFDSLNHININAKIIYFGDRDIDEQFCVNTNIDFAYVSDFCKFWEIDI